MKGKPNILLICTDHWPASLRTSRGHPTIQTPTVDALAARGVDFARVYSECPVCIPARRTIMTGTTPRTHGDRVYSDQMPMPKMPTLASTFRDAGYQTSAVGKLHVYPQRNRIGFEETLITEEARYDFGVVDDYQIWLGEMGLPGKEFLHGMGSNTYFSRPWHLSEHYHVTNWITREAAKRIKRHDPTRPGFFYVSYTAPHPPLVPPQPYLDMYDLETIDPPCNGSWIDSPAFPIQALRNLGASYTEREIALARRAFYASCTHIDHQIRLLIGTLRECNLLENSVIGFMSDHGDMLFNHGMVAKRVFYEESAHVPFILAGRPLEISHGTVDNQLGCLADVMPTLLGIANIETPATVEGLSLLEESDRELLYGELGEGDTATRMATDGRYKLVYYPTGNLSQLFDLEKDPQELSDLLHHGGQDKPELSPIESEIHARLTRFLLENLHGDDLHWVSEGKLTGRPNKAFTPPEDIGLYNQRGYHWPPPAGYENLGKNM